MPRSVNACTDVSPKIPLRVKNVEYNTSMNEMQVKKKVIKTGSFIASPTSRDTIVYFFDLRTSTDVQEKIHINIPIKNGIWIYWDELGNLQRREIWYLGKLITIF